LPCPAEDPLGPGIAVDETAQLKRGRHTVATGVQWAGCLGHQANCATSVFLSYVTPRTATWITHGLFLPKKDWFTGTGATGQDRRGSAGVPEETVFQTKPQIACRKFQEMRDLGVRFSWASGDEVYGRYAALRADHEKTMRPTPISSRRISLSRPAPEVGPGPMSWPDTPSGTSRSGRRDRG